MKRIAVPIISSILFGQAAAQQDTTFKDSFYVLTPVEVRAVRAGEHAPFTKTNLGRKDIAKMNLAQDIPFLLNQTPSVVVNSDAGNGIGYTGIRIRGTDATRINVTLNGIPYNDAESQGTFFVDLPDFSSSTGSIQVQRGVGTSSNGTGAFGGSINISTNELNRSAYAEVNNSYGSFDTWKNTVRAGTGLLGEHFTTDIRLSNITSNGYIDRARSDLQSYYLSSAYTDDKQSVRLNIFSGKEKTYQAWYGVSEADLLAGQRTINYAGTEKPGEPYENETDNYKQDHYQLFFNRQLNSKLSFNAAFFLTKGEGYYEQYKADEEYAKYGLSLPGNADFVRQLWLDNDFYGGIFSLQLITPRSQATLGGALTLYDGKHFGEITWASNGLPAPSHRWYDHHSDKNDLTVYIKENYRIRDHWNLFADIQYRHVDYTINGFRDHPDIHVNSSFNFFNPKAGISYSRNGWKGYFSYALAHKEPNRDDFEAGITQQPRAEQLHDLELGIEHSLKSFQWAATLFYMRYRDQLILTGKINDVGAYTRINIPESYRAGIELQAGARLTDWLGASGNLAFSTNKVKNFAEFIDDYDNGGQKMNFYGTSDIAYSPAIVGAATIEIKPLKNLELGLVSKYVGDQYLDNTGNKNRQLDAFYVQDARLIYRIGTNWVKEILLIGQVNNLFSRKYEPNGYTFSYIYGGSQVTENYYFPMAGRNFMVALNVKL
jgi:iron complex outermembrane recepter protein